MHTRSAFLLLALFIGSVHASGPSHNNHARPLVARAPADVQLEQRQIDGDALRGLVEIRAPSDFDRIARAPTPVAAAEPAPVAAAQPPPFALDDDSPFAEYEGAGVLAKRACVA